ncbi:protein kinase [Candidatus Uabimicrobium amorphum]|uniref:Protein kinase n=1 Tax=Uabimicrobium amorphum TaxID=2596890 RepID=A0A5S9F357_UABAM|nr:protein kinase [Candidatus Uabimicrobium amorphum]
MYLATDSKHQDRKVAVKVIHPQNLGTGDCLQRLKREARYLLRLSHPNIVQLYDFFEDNKQFFLVMEYIEGVTLEEVFLSGEPLSIEEKFMISYQLVSAIHTMNSAELIHRDIKPSNIIYIAKRRQIKLVDLGIAKSISTQNHTCSLTKTNAILGTPGYMSPEQVNGDTTDKSDVFTTATVIYQLFANLCESPFLGTNNLNTMLKVSTQELTRLKDVAKEEIPHIVKLSHIVEQALCKDPRRRISIDNFYDEIRGITSKYLPTNETCIVEPRVSRKSWRFVKEQKSPKPWSLYIMLSLTLILGGSLALIFWGFAQHTQQESLEKFTEIMQYFSQRKFEKAWSENEKFLTQSPQEPYLWMLKSFMLHDGMGTRRQLYESKRIAKKWYKKLPQNTKYTHYFLAKCYFHGLGVAQDLPTALIYARKASLKAFPLAFTCLGEIYLKLKNNPAAFRAFTSGTNLGCVEAKRQLAMFHLHGKVVARNGQIALELLQESFRGGNIFASNSIGFIYYNGTTLVPKDQVMGETWFIKGANLRDPICLNNMASIYLQEHGTAQQRKTLVEISEMFTSAAQNNCDLAMRALGNMCLRKFERPYQGLFWLFRSILHGNNLAKNDLIALAKHTPRKKIRVQILLGNNYARYVLGHWLIKRLGKPTKGMYWLIQAHLNDTQQLGIIDDIVMQQEGGNIFPSSHSQIKEGAVVLGFFYEKGIGVDMDVEKAQEYYKKAVELGEDSPKILQKIHTTK